MTKSELEQEIKLIDSEVEKYTTTIINADEQVDWLKKRRKLAVAQLAAISAKPESKTENPEKKWPNVEKS